MHVCLTGTCITPLVNSLVSKCWFHCHLPQRIHLDIQVGEHANDYQEIAAKDKLTELQLRIRQLLDQVEQISKEQNYQRVGEEITLESVTITENLVLLLLEKEIRKLRKVTLDQCKSSIRNNEFFSSENKNLISLKSVKYPLCKNYFRLTWKDSGSYSWVFTVIVNTTE